MENNVIKVFDDVISLEENLSLYDTILYQYPFFYGERDNKNLPTTGLIFNLNTEDKIFQQLYFFIMDKNPELKNLKLERAYINLFFCYDRPFFHKDGKVITNLFYINPPTTPDDGGETQFLKDDDIIGIFPKPGRLVTFDGMLSHRATSFRNMPRITVAFKFIK